MRLLADVRIDVTQAMQRIGARCAFHAEIDVVVVLFVGGAGAANDTSKFFDAQIVDDQIHNHVLTDFELCRCLDLNTGDRKMEAIS